MFLSMSTAQLNVVQVCESKGLDVLNKSNEGKVLLVPYINSMYVPGKLYVVEHMLSVETGYYVKKMAKDN